jgi:Fe2+ or Zn2+ uptake regulation protein
MPAPGSPAPTRRNRTRQRRRLLELLRSTDRHPTAAWLYAALQPEFPRLSLGTVYRNLEVLVCEGLVREVPTPGSAVRFDGNPAPHHHFVCERCGRIDDLELALPAGLAERVRRRYRLRPRRMRIDFFGLCRECTGREEDGPTG